MDNFDQHFAQLHLPSFPDCYPDRNPVDIYRSFITEKLSTITGIDASIIYPSLQWTQTLEKGDLTLAVPRLRVKGKPPVDLAQHWSKQVLWIILHITFHA